MKHILGVLKEMEEKEDKLKAIQQQKTDKIRETMAKLSNVSSSKATEEDVLKILSECLKALAEAKEKWENIVKFFREVEVWIEDCSKEVVMLFLFGTSWAYPCLARVPPPPGIFIFSSLSLSLSYSIFLSLFLSLSLFHFSLFHFSHSLLSTTPTTALWLT
jgi:hypothetical protein